MPLRNQLQLPNGVIYGNDDGVAVRGKLNLEGRTRVLIPRELKEAARAHTARSGTPPGGIVRIALKQYLEKQKVSIEAE